ncbi:MAG: DUF3263 domain-containing protein [Gordonia polyisoprenivorans]|nr:DUF3263 domain-containing protein [Gordonia polyisoprenivorans]
MTDDDRKILQFAGWWWHNADAAESAIRNELGLSPVRFYQRLNRLIDEPAAIECEPQLVNRLRRIRAARAEGATWVDAQH